MHQSLTLVNLVYPHDATSRVDFGVKHVDHHALHHSRRLHYQITDPGGIEGLVGSGRERTIDHVRELQPLLLRHCTPNRKCHNTAS